MKQALFVEDSRISQALMRKYLNELCEVTMVSSLPRAFEMAQERQFDLVLLDFMFPDGDSLGLIRHFRQSAPADKLPIVVVSSSMDRILMNRVLKAGANEALCKPPGIEAFRALIRRMLHEPYVRSASETVHVVSCLAWQAGGVHHQFCPDLQVAVFGPTKAEAAQRMQRLLDQACVNGADLGNASSEEVITHVVRGGDHSGAPSLASLDASVPVRLSNGTPGSEKTAASDAVVHAA